MSRARPLLVGAAGAVFGVVLAMLSGVIDVASTSRQSAFGDWFFGLAVRQSITLRSVGVEVPPLHDTVPLRSSAVHYDLVCAACHGAPGKPPEAFAAELVPRPPSLVAQMERWRPPARIFWTVKHGIRHTAMPAWPTQLRDDEIWAMVAFLLALPGMSPARYAELAGTAEGAVCGRCHRQGGEVGGSAPRLDIQSPGYLAAALRAFRDGSRASGTMMSVARTLTDDEIASLAAGYGTAAAVGPPSEVPGGSIALHGIPDRKVPACESCHGRDARADFPRLAGQERDFILNQLHLFKALGASRGGRHARIMADVATGLTEAEMAALADWYSRRSGPTSASGGVIRSRDGDAP